jgi:hypothetical protein
MLVMLVMSNRLQRLLKFLIDLTQSAFLVGRDITSNMRYHLALSARQAECGLPGWLLFSDLSKAYNSVNRDRAYPGCGPDLLLSLWHYIRHPHAIACGPARRCSSRAGQRPHAD